MNLYIKTIALIVCLLCLVSVMASCATLSNGDNPTINQTTENKDNMMPVDALGVIQMESIDDIVNLIKNPDVKEYREDLQVRYQEFFSVLKAPGYIYKVVTSDSATEKDAVTLFERDGENLYFIMSYAKLEDIGIVSYVTFRGVVYNICIYNVDKQFLSDSKNISKYLEARFGRKVLSEITTEKNTVCFTTEGDGKTYLKNCATSFIDSNYYYIVKTDATQDELKTFLNFLNLEKISIE